MPYVLAQSACYVHPRAADQARAVSSAARPGPARCNTVYGWFSEFRVSAFMHFLAVGLNGAVGGCEGCSGCDWAASRFDWAAVAGRAAVAERGLQ